LQFFWEAWWLLFEEDVRLLPLRALFVCDGRLREYIGLF
jgi:hypothetical protein